MRESGYTPTSGSASSEVLQQLPAMVKGAGYRKPRAARDGGGFAPLDGDIVYEKAAAAESKLRESVSQSYRDPDAVMKSLSPSFSSQFGLFGMRTPGISGMSEMIAGLNEVSQAVLGKNFTLSSPLSSGFVPFDLLAPSKLIYPVYSPMRNKLPRVQGQGTARKTKVVTGVQGSQTGTGNSAKRVSIAESDPASAYPATLPPAGRATAVDVSIPYKFFGLSESLSWLAQFSGQGFQDVSALANLVLMQEMMLGEEYQLLWGTGTAISTPGAPTVAIRTAGSNETGIAAAGTGNSYYVRVTATSIYGETLMSAAGEAAVAAQTGKVLDVTIAPVRGATQYNIYISAAATSGTAPATRTSYFLQTAGLGGAKFTIQGALASSGTNPPAADSGTSSTNDYEGLFSVLSGHAATDASVYPAGFSAGYLNQSMGTRLTLKTLGTALQNLWNGPGAFRADPSEIICEASDAVQLSNDVLTNVGSGAAYRFMIDQGSVGGITGGAAVSMIQNPVTRSVLNILVHPWWTQGSAMLMSYTMPMPLSNISNIFEVTNVQDYLSVSWPVIDPTFRYSIFLLGALVAHAPQFCGLIQGLQVADATPYS